MTHSSPLRLALVLSLLLVAITALTGRSTDASAAVTAGDVVYLSSDGSSAGIYQLHAADNSTSLILEGPDIHGPTVSPDGSRIAFYGHFGADAALGIYVIKSDGSGASQLVGRDPCEDNLGGCDGQPFGFGYYDVEWSPDGKSLGYVKYSTATGLWRLKTVDVATGAQTDVFDNTGGIESVSFSPDGTRLAYNVADGGGRQIHIIGIDGSNDHRATSAPPAGTAYSLAWSHDGSRIYYRKGDSGISYLTYTGSGEPFSSPGATEVDLTD